MNKIKLNGNTYLLPARWNDITDSRQFIAAAVALYEFETGVTSFDELRIALTIAFLGIHPSKIRQSETLAENLFRISELLDFPYKIVEHEDGIRTAVITISLKQNLLPELGGVPGYRYQTDSAEVVDTSVTAEQYIEALSLMQLYRQMLNNGKDITPSLDNLVQTFYPGATGVSREEKIALFYNWRGIMATISKDPDYDLIFNGTHSEDYTPSPVGPQAALFSLSKAGYGNIEQIRRLDIHTYLSALVHQTIDSIRALASSGMKTGEIASRLNLSIEQVAPYITNKHIQP